MLLEFEERETEVREKSSMGKAISSMASWRSSCVLLFDRVKCMEFG